MIPFIEVLDRAHTGPVCELKEWDINVISKKVKEKLKEYGLEGTCDTQNPINSDDGLADRFWKAGFDLAVDTGMLCLETKRIIKFTEEELKEALGEAPSEITLGRGADAFTLRARKPEDKTPPRFRSGFGGVSEHIYVQLMQGIAQYRVVDILTPADLETIYDRGLKTATPYETIAGHHEAVMIREALKRAGRQGMPITGVCNSPSEYGHMGGYGTPGGYDPLKDMAIVLAITELKTSYGLLHKVAQTALNCGGIVYGAHWSMIGGYAGPPEGAAVGAVASFVLQFLVHSCTLSAGVVYDIRYQGNCGRDAVWARSVSHQAQSINKNLMALGMNSQVSGPCTHELLYETTVGCIVDAVSGCAAQFGNRSTGSRYIDYQSPLEQKFGAEVLKASAGMKRSDANEIVKALIPKYEDKLRRPPKGKSFIECFDLRTLKPTKEWQEIYDKTWEEIEDLGLPKPF